jgi:hypothetical protein
MEEIQLKFKMEQLASMRTAYAALVERFEADHAEARLLMEGLEGEIRAAVLEAGETLESDHLKAVWNKGRVTWNSRLLEGYAMAHPDILQARKEGAPTVSFRIIKEWGAE